MNAAALLFGSSPASSFSASSETDKVTKTDDFQQVFQIAWQEQKTVSENAESVDLTPASDPASLIHLTDSLPEQDSTVDSAMLVTDSGSEIGLLLEQTIPSDEKSPTPQVPIIEDSLSALAPLPSAMPLAPPSTALSFSMADLTAEIFKSTLQTSEDAEVTPAELSQETPTQTPEASSEVPSRAISEHLFVGDIENSELKEDVPDVEVTDTAVAVETTEVVKTPEVEAFLALSVPVVASHGLTFFQNQRSGFSSQARSSLASLAPSLGNPDLLLHSLSVIDESFALLQPNVNQAPQALHAFSAMTLPPEASAASTAFQDLLSAVSPESVMTQAQGSTPEALSSSQQGRSGAVAVPGSPTALLSEAATQLETRFEVFKQLEQHMYLLRHHQQREIQIQLEPAQLGKLNLRLQQEGHLFQLHITAENAVAKEILDAHIQQLKNQFAQQGFELDSVEVNVHSDTSGGFDSETSQGSGSAAFLMPHAVAMPFSLLSGGTDDGESPLLNYGSAASTYYYHQVNYFA